MDPLRSHRLVHVINNREGPDNTIQIVTFVSCVFIHRLLGIYKFLINTREKKQEMPGV